MKRYGGRTVLAAALAGALALAGCIDGGTTGPPGDGDPRDFFGGAPPPDVDALLAGLEMDSALARISPADIAGHIGALAHDSMMGRLTGARELEDAAAYIAAALAAAAVEPAGTDAFMARWPFIGWGNPPWADSLAYLPPNVVGVVRGSDPALADRYVVVTAHYDHIGWDTPDADGDSIFNGADDNASGTAVLLEVAEALAALPTPPRRSVLFLAVSGEELGLLGSEAYMLDPTVPVADMVANINLDMVSRGTDGTAYAIGYGLSTLGLVARAVSDQHPEIGVRAESDQALGQDLLARSDHFHFARNRVPALGMFGGLHPDYHTRNDEAPLVDTDKAAAIARLATYLAAAVAMMDDEPAWTDFGAWYMRQYW